MRCSCQACGAYMVQSERGANSACVCPYCAHQCTACMGSGVQMTKGGGVPLDILMTYEWGEGIIEEEDES